MRLNPRGYDHLGQIGRELNILDGANSDITILNLGLTRFDPACGGKDNLNQLPTPRIVLPRQNHRNHQCQNRHQPNNGNPLLKRRLWRRDARGGEWLIHRYLCLPVISASQMDRGSKLWALNIVNATQRAKETAAIPGVTVATFSN